MAGNKPPGYGELADVLESLPLILHEMRRARGLSLREAAREMDVSFSTVARFEAGEDGVNMTTVLAVMRWIDHADHAERCCRVHNTHSMPHRGCIHR